MSGSGRTALLAHFVGRARLTGDRVLTLRVEDFVDSGSGGAGQVPRPGDGDRVGAGLLASAVREIEDEGESVVRYGRSLRLIDRLLGVKSQWTVADRSALRAEVSRLLRSVASAGYRTLVMDDVDLVAAPTLLVVEARRLGFRVVVSTCCDRHSLSTTGQIIAVADRFVDIRPLSDEAAVELLGRLVGGQTDRRLVDAVNTALGRLVGIPATLASTIEALRSEGRLVPVHRCMCLRGEADTVALSPEHPLVRVVNDTGPLARQLVALAAGPAGLDIADLPVVAAALDRPVLACGAVLDELVRTSVLDQVGGQRLAPSCPAVAAAARRDSKPDELQVLHGRMSTQLREWGGAQADVAMHIVGAGPHHDTTAADVTLLRDEAARVTAEDPRRALDLLRATRVTGAVEPEAWRRQGELLRAAARAGAMEQLADIVEEIVLGRGFFPPPRRAELAASAALAALYLGRRPSTAVRGALAEIGNAACPFRLCESWWAGGAVSLDEVVRCFAPLAPSAGFHGSVDQVVASLYVPDPVRKAFARRRLIPLLNWLLGLQDEVRGEGPMTWFDRVISGYTEGRWDEAVSAARALQLEPGLDLVDAPWAALIAYIIEHSRGRDRRAEHWSRTVAEAEHLPLKDWIPVAAYRPENPDAAFELGWSIYRQVGGEGARRGVWAGETLDHLAMMAYHSGRPAWCQQVLDECERVEQEAPDAVLPEYLHLIRGLLGGSAADARRGVELWRRSGSLPDLALALLQAAPVVEDPAPLLVEGMRIAESLGAVRLVREMRSTAAALGADLADHDAEPDLTDLERRLVGLIRSGRTNRQIGVVLSVSEKTVENQLTRVYAKTGFRSRHELTAAGLGERFRPAPPSLRRPARSG
ncbi:helix-turn-helix transcriptional regulator [Pseudonocardia sp. ICBG1122]|nr:helix-turn-helix transcriptional regulator [Pseudonocardia pini]